MAYRSQRQHRYDIYKSAGFLNFEAQELSGVRFSEAPYLRRMIKTRLKIKLAFDKESDFNKWSRTRREKEWRNIVRQEYIDNVWVRETKQKIGRTAYKASPWEMLRDYREQAIDRGEYHPPKRKGVRRVGDKIYIHILKGDVQKQKARQRAKLSADKGSAQYQRLLEQKRAQHARARQREKERQSPLSDRG